MLLTIAHLSSEDAIRLDLQMDVLMSSCSIPLGAPTLILLEFYRLTYRLNCDQDSPVKSTTHVSCTYVS